MGHQLLHLLKMAIKRWNVALNSVQLLLIGRCFCQGGDCLQPATSNLPCVWFPVSTQDIDNSITEPKADIELIWNWNSHHSQSSTHPLTIVHLLTVCPICWLYVSVITEIVQYPQLHLHMLHVMFSICNISPKIRATWVQTLVREDTILNLTQL